MTTVLCVGAAVVDFVFYLDQFPDKPEKYRAKSAKIVGGGCAANAAVAVARLSGKALLGARLGDDSIGDLIIADLVAEGVDTENITRTRGAHSSYSSIYVDDAGERQIVNYRGKGLVLDTDWFDDIPQLDAVLADTRRVEAGIAAMEIARARGVPGIVDGEAPVDPSILGPASHAAFSLQGLQALVPDQPPTAALTEVATTFECWACVTDGSNGVWYTAGDTVQHVPAFQVDVKDTLGAGDVWHGAFALALAEGADEAGAIDIANAAAALKCMTYGGRNGAPTRLQLNDFLKENGK